MSDSLMPKAEHLPTAGNPQQVQITGQPIDVDIITCAVTLSVDVVTAQVPTAPYLQTIPRLTSASVNCSAAGNNVLIAAAGTDVIWVYRLMIVFAAADTCYFRDGAAGAAFTGAMTMTQGGSIVLDLDGEPWFTTSAGNAFVLNMTAGVQASGRIWYLQG